MGFWILLFLFCLASSRPSSAATFNVINFGAVGDGRTDDSQAFLEAWKAVCQSQTNAPTLVVPGKRTFMLKPVRFTGPCKSPRIYVQVSGNIVAPSQKTDWKGFHVDSWITFSFVNGLVINGRGQIDGRGPVWWSEPCLANGAQCKGPNALIFNRCNNLVLSGLTHINSPRVHITLTACDRVLFSNFRIIAPGTSPNTDGIGISASTNVQIRNSYIGTGDDCIAINGGSSKISITGVTCGPGHGISIGSLGGGGFETVEDVNVLNCTLKRTTNGLRLKTWQGGSGYARKISFNQIRMVEVANPIIVDQFYCPDRVNCTNDTSSSIKLSDISYTGISGTSTTDNAINLSCSQNLGCTNVVLDHVYILSATPGKKTYSTCFNAHGKATHTKPSVKCLLP